MFDHSNVYADVIGETQVCIHNDGWNLHIRSSPLKSKCIMFKLNYFVDQKLITF